MRELRSNAMKRMTVVALLVLMVMGLMSASQAAVVEPELRLIAATDRVTVEKGKGERAFLGLGVYLAATDAPFEIRAERDDYMSPVEVTQILRTSTGGTETRALPAELLDGWYGLKDFFNVQIANAAGEVVIDDDVTFCPNGYNRQRISENGPANPTYPTQCSANPFTKGMVWGIDEGWAASIDRGDLSYRVPVGRYSATVSVNERYTDLFGVDPASASKTLSLRVELVEGCRYCGASEPHAQAQEGAATAEVPTDETPDLATLPDLISLPAWGINVQQGRSKTRLAFGATVWVDGNASLVVEGFRRENEDLMDAYQYFYKGDEPVGKAPVGSFEFDRRDGHGHWHFQQFARYSLLTADKTEAVRSRKEAFCLAATDAIDVLIPGVSLNPGNHDLYSACGSADALWIRETLPLGWGDTYFQSLPGQSFDITNLPNGTYYILVEANPGGSLHELTPDNNIELREIQIKGRPGHRRVVVPPWNSIETEEGNDGHRGG